MVGRPRKQRAPSVSTVATVDDNAIRYLRESTVLKPAPASAHTDDWPCFLLVDATVYHRNGSMANLLHVDLEGPLIVRGRLEVEKDQEGYLLHRPSKSKSPWIQIQSSTSFSIGQKDDHGLSVPVLWASGESGWFEIVPSDRYKAIADVMFQGIDLHYSILDQYEDALAKLHRKKKNRAKTLQHVELPLDDLLFHDIVKRLAEKDPATAQELAESTHPMLRAASSSLEFPDTTSQDHTVAARASAQRSTRNSETLKGGPIDLSSDGQQAPNNKVTRTKRRSPTNVKPANVDVEMLNASASTPSSSEAVTPSPGLPVLLGTLQEIRNSTLELLRDGKNKRHPDHIMPGTWHYKIYLACKIKHRQGGAEICEYWARDLVEVLGPEWRQSEFYKWAKANANTKPKFEYSTETECVGLRRRNARQPKVTTEDKGQPSHTGKQPAPVPAPEPAGKQPPKKRGRPSGKAAGLRPSLGGKKRPWAEADLDGGDDDEMDFGGYDPEKTTKKSKYFSDDDADAASSTAEGDEEAEPGSASLTRLVIRAEKLPSTTPKGPNQTWTCGEPDCGYVVRGADEDEGQNLISAHYEAHEREARDEAEEAALKRVNLAVQESGGHLPINHLLDKIRSMGNKVQQRNEVGLNGELLPQPIKRTLLV
ncbi:hypothetical protein DL762_003937 [Monosporascus cannonballus]|uniref:DNA (cytosine-5)-methyltransferase 1 replication foci domain-containing protein n=1 Tax=Monosporascus cannonballus TaxID=155416 RepID=A0ABY0H969_9PEZI|nr:hypothetical protein DL762_003937 [Monosporascus cannonballus]